MPSFGELHVLIAQLGLPSGLTNTLYDLLNMFF